MRPDSSSVFHLSVKFSFTHVTEKSRRFSYEFSNLHDADSHEHEADSLIIWGTQDRVFPLHVGHEMAARIPHPSILEIPNSGHMPQWEQPDAVNQALLRFVDET